MAESVKSAVIAGRGLIARLGEAAIDANDSEEIRLRKSPAHLRQRADELRRHSLAGDLLWMGLKLPTTILALGFQILSALVVAIYLRTRNFDFFRVAQLALFLFFPFIMQWSIGSFVSASGIVLLAILAPIGGMVCYGLARVDSLVFPYVVLTIVSGMFDFFLARGDENGMPLRTIAVFLRHELHHISTMLYLLLRYFVQERDRYEKQLAEQHELVHEREKSERLLVSILPSHIAERLKLQPGTIADGFADVR